MDINIMNADLDLFSSGEFEHITAALERMHREGLLDSEVEGDHLRIFRNDSPELANLEGGSFRVLESVAFRGQLFFVSEVCSPFERAS